MKRVALACACVVTAVLGAATASAVGSPPAAPITSDKQAVQVAECLQPILDAFRERSGFPGGGIGFVLADGTAGAIASGLSDVEDASRMTIGHRLPAGSVGKTFFAAVAMMLANQGVLELDQPIATILSEHEWFKRLPNADAVTVRMLLNHTSGIPEHVRSSNFLKAIADNPDRHWQSEELIAFILDKPPLFEAGTGWAYADANYILLGIVMESATSDKAYDLVSKRILKPHGLLDVLPQDRRDLPKLACGYMQPGRSLIEVDHPRTLNDGRFFINPQFEWCGGGFIATPCDLARWTKLLWSGSAILPENTREMMVDGVAAQTGRGHQYGLGVQIRPTSHGITFGHGGYFPGSMTETVYYTEHGLALSIMVNSDHHTSPRSLMQCLDECADAIIRASGKH